MALVSIPSTNCFSVRPPLEGKVRLPLTNKKPGPVTCRIGKIDEVQPKTFFGRRSFPPGFTFGAASSAYQVEGGAEEGRKGPSIWDTFTHTHPEKITDHLNGDVACDSYHRYKEDVQLLKDMGMDAYRFSLSWSRILPTGKIGGGISQEGIDYYNNLINELIKNGLRPYVTLFHWDVPQALEDEYGGFLDRKIVQDFKDYCEVCFKEFGDRVIHWITLNEPWTFSSLGYGIGYHAPGRCSEDMGCTSGDSLKEPYIVTHNLILAHAAAFRLYEEKFKDTQKGEVGITLNVQWYLPYSESRPDYEAANRAIDFMFGWYMEPLAFGDYPFIMKAVLRERLPNFTNNDITMIQNSYDFIGINYYTTQYARSRSSDFHPTFNIDDSYAEQLGEKDGVPIGNLEGTWIYVYPKGIRDTLMEVSRRYNNPKIYITENGTCELDDSANSLTLGEALDDEPRIAYYSRHLGNVREAIRNGVNVKGYFAWSLTDNFEWDKGYTNRFGIIYIDYKNNHKRLPKKSSKWFTKFLKS